MKLFNFMSVGFAGVFWWSLRECSSITKIPQTREVENQSM